MKISHLGDRRETSRNKPIISVVTTGLSVPGHCDDTKAQCLQLPYPRH